MTDKYEHMQGKNSSIVFKAEAKYPAIETLYGESAELFLRIINSRLSNKNKFYHLADFGSFRGELLLNLSEQLRKEGYNLRTIALDASKSALEKNVADERIHSSLTSIDLPNDHFDFSICRYALAWNKINDQMKILAEISRLNKEFAIVQHAGADIENPDLWRERMGYLLSGEKIPKLKRDIHFFSSSKEIEQGMDSAGIKYYKVNEVKVDEVSDVLITRFDLDSSESILTKKLLEDKDFIIRTTWLVGKDFRKIDPWNNRLIF